MKKFSDKVIVYMGSSFVDSFLQIVIGMLLVRYLTKYDYGTFRQIMLVAVLISTTIAIGLPQSLSYFIPRASTSQEKKQLAFQVFTVLTLLGLVAATTSYLFRFRISSGFNNTELLQYSWVFSLFFLFLIPSKCTQPTLVALGRTNFASFLNVGTAIVNFFFVIIPLILGKDLKIILVSMLSVYVLKFLIVIYILSSLDGGFPRLLDKHSFKKQLSYSVPLGGSLMLGVARKYIDQFIIAALYNPVNFAIYSRGAFELPLVNLLPYNLSTLMVPKIAEYYKEGKISSIVYLWQESMRKVALVLFPVFIYSFIFADFIISFLFTKEYLDSVRIFRIYLLLLPIRIGAYRTILQAIGQTRHIFTATIISLITGIVLGIIFERIFGLIGPAIGIVIASFVAPAYLLIQTRIHLKLSISVLLPIKKLFLPMICSVAVGVITLPISMLNLYALYTLLISGFIYFLLYIIIMKFFNIFTESEWDLVVRWATLRVLFNRKNIRKIRLDIRNFSEKIREY